ARAQQLREVHAVALPAREVADPLVLIRPAEIERGHVCAAVPQLAADVDLILAVADLLPHRLRRRERVTRLRHVGELYRLADAQRTRVRRLLAGDEAEQRRLPRPVRPDHADDAAARQLEGEVIEEEPVAVSL